MLCSVATSHIHNHSAEVTDGKHSQSVDCSTATIYPYGGTWPYASPEQLLEMQCRLEGCALDPIIGPAADLWAVGAVLIETADWKPPFLPDDSASLPEAPAHVPNENKKMWQLYEAVLQQHDEWVSLKVHLHCVPTGKAMQYRLKFDTPRRHLRLVQSFGCSGLSICVAICC